VAFLATPCRRGFLKGAVPVAAGALSSDQQCRHRAMIQYRGIGKPASLALPFFGVWPTMPPPFGRGIQRDEMRRMGGMWSWNDRSLRCGFMHGQGAVLTHHCCSLDRARRG
jgi:hypothetical protein